MPSGQRHFAKNFYNICKGNFGSRGKKHPKRLKDTFFIFSMTNVKILDVFHTHVQKEYGKIWEMKSTPFLNILALFTFSKVAMYLLKNSK